MKAGVQQALEELKRVKLDEPICSYIYDLAGIQAQVREMLQTMPVNTRLFYAIKANPDPRIIEALLPWVKGFEVASIGELLKVRAVSRDVPILFGGPGKKESELKQALEQDVSYIHVESVLELRRIIAIAKERIVTRDEHMKQSERNDDREPEEQVQQQRRQAGREAGELAVKLADEQVSAQSGKRTGEQEDDTEYCAHKMVLEHPEQTWEVAGHRGDVPEVRVLLRINLRSSALPQTKIVMGGSPSPFGMDEEDLEEAIELLRVEGAGVIRLCGFHFHSLSNNMDAGLHAEMIELYLQKVEQWQQRYHVQVDIVNAGGGFGVTYDGSPGFDWPLFTKLLEQSESRKRLAARGGELFFESGRLLVAEHGYYAAEVTDIKRSHGEWFAIVRGGTHHQRLPASWGHNHPFQIVYTEQWQHAFSRPEVKQGRVHIAGELCTPKDRLHSDAEVERLRVGDIVVFVKSGAYSWTISHHDFLGHPHPAFHYLTEEDEHVNANSVFQSASR
ncbi:diaminopimelate decarboxylase [Paenibacillus barcinonensis]|uniref:Diaminopimelate decarboxylase n=2 Tax=Paenibacillus barcinonensis TaxID=198119 RepID=A0A2V4V4L4_PAEBA|nr:type III PLP-dependent enzyme [Paenibacillus barcinonensis]PYE47233.1 diaminopimelate decarboxylase [Paenibacillus barcinonensis]